MMTEASASLDGKTRIRRYLSLSKFLDIIENQRFYLSAISAFEDKLEGKLNIVDDFILNGLHKQLHLIVNYSLPEAFGSASKSVEVSKRKEALEADIKSHAINTVFGEIAPTSSLPAAKIIDWQKNWLDVMCWDRNPHESMAMWKVYGGADAAVCVHTTVDSLRRSLLVPDHLVLHIDEVDYVDFDGPYMGGHPLGYFLRKHVAYGYENEVRATVYDPNTAPMSERPGMTGTYLSADIAAMLNEITVSSEATTWFVELIKKIVRERLGSQIPVRTSSVN